MAPVASATLSKRGRSTVCRSVVGGRIGGILIVIDTGVLISGRSRDKQRSNNFVPNTDGRVLTNTTQNLFNRLMFKLHKVIHLQIDQK